MIPEDLLGWLTNDRDSVMDRFASLPGALVSGAGDEQYCYVPGRRRDRVLLVAHADTVWDGMPGYPGRVIYETGVYKSATPGVGTGADDHAGCAILWALREGGHSLLITCGEERGSLAARRLMADPAMAREVNETHRFAVQFDRRGGGDFKCYDVGTDEFRAYVAAVTGFTEPDRKWGTDIKALCRSIAGVNLSVGYHYEHTPEETLVYAEWAATLALARAWLGGTELPLFALNGGRDMA